MKIVDMNITIEMVNKSTSMKKEDMPLNSVTGERLLETSEPVDEIFAGFAWMGLDQVRVEVENEGWN